MIYIVITIALIIFLLVLGYADGVFELPKKNKEPKVYALNPLDSGGDVWEIESTIKRAKSQLANDTRGLFASIKASNGYASTRAYIPYSELTMDNKGIERVVLWYIQQVTGLTFESRQKALDWEVSLTSAEIADIKKAVEVLMETDIASLGSSANTKARVEAILEMNAKHNPEPEVEIPAPEVIKDVEPRFLNKPANSIMTSAGKVVVGTMSLGHTGPRGHDDYYAAAGNGIRIGH